MFRPSVPSLARDRDPDGATTAAAASFGAYSSVGPFNRLDPNPDARELVKMLLLGTTLLPLRAVAILLIVASYWAASMLYVTALPHLRHRSDTLRGLTQLTGRSLLLVCGFHRIDVYGDDSPSDDCSVVMVSNHVSFWEILYFMSSPSCPAFAFKSGCLRVPFVGEIALKVLQGIRIDREEGGGARAVVAAVRCRRDAEDPGEYRPLLIFPEGTTGNGSSMLRFRSGAFVPGSPVRPVLISLPHEGSFSPSYESIYLTVLALRTLTQFRNRMEVRYLDVYVPSKEENKDAKLYAHNVRSYMARAAGLPLCDAGYREKRKYQSRLARRLRSHPLGWLSNILYVNPPALSDETSLEPLVYQYSCPFATPRVNSCFQDKLGDN